MSVLKDDLALLAIADQFVAEATAALDEMVDGFDRILALGDRIDALAVGATHLWTFFDDREIGMILMLAVERLHKAKAAQR